MDDKDFLKIAEELRSQFLSIGLGELAEPANYEFEEGGERHFLPPIKYVFGMIDAFDRYLSTIDKQTYLSSMATIREFTRGDAPERAVIITTENEQNLLDVPPSIDLSEIDDLSKIRQALASLKEELQSSYDPPTGSDDRGGQ